MFKLLRMISVLMEFIISLVVDNSVSRVFGAEFSGRSFYFQVCWDCTALFCFVRNGFGKKGCQWAESMYQSYIKKKVYRDYGYCLKN